MFHYAEIPSTLWRVCSPFSVGDEHWPCVNWLSPPPDSIPDGMHSTRASGWRNPFRWGGLRVSPGQFGSASYPVGVGWSEHTRTRNVNVDVPRAFIASHRRTGMIWLRRVPLTTSSWEGIPGVGNNCCESVVRVCGISSMIWLMLCCCEMMIDFYDFYQFV